MSDLCQPVCRCGEVLQNGLYLFAKGIFNEELFQLIR